MGKHFLRDLPPEIRDQIYTHVLATTATGIIDLRPWTIAVERSLSLLRTCKQIHRECKDLIWQHNGMALRDDHNQLFDRLSKLYAVDSPPRYVTIVMNLELLDIDELAWACRGLKAILNWPSQVKVHRIHMSTQFDQPRGVSEFTTLLHIRANGELLDGRSSWVSRHTSSNQETLGLQTVWPAFSHWGKQRWFKEMLLNNSDPRRLLEDLRMSLGGKRICVEGPMQSLQSCSKTWLPTKLDARNGSLSIHFDDVPFLT